MAADLRNALETALTVALHETFDPGCTGEPPYDSSQRLAAEVTAVVMRQPVLIEALASSGEAAPTPVAKGPVEGWRWAAALRALHAAGLAYEDQPEGVRAALAAGAAWGEAAPVDGLRPWPAAAFWWHEALMADPYLPDCGGTHALNMGYCQRLAALAREEANDGR